MPPPLSPHRFASLVLSLALAAVAAARPRAQAAESPNGPAADSDARGSSSVFVPNLGQWPHDARFVLQRGPLTWLVEPCGWTLDAVEPPPRDADPKKAPHPRRGAAVRMTFEDTGGAPQLAGEDVLPGHHDYFLGKDPSRWRTEVPLYAAVRYRGLYSGVELRLRTCEGQPEYDLLLEPNADLARVTVRVEGAERLYVASDGALVAETALGPMTQPLPRTWQTGPDGATTAVACRYVLLGADRFGFRTEGWDRALALTIDPGLLWSTYLGGLLSDTPYDLFVDKNGVVTVAGETSAANFPTTVGAYRTNHALIDAFVSRLDPGRAGNEQLLWSTFLGGSDDDYARAMHVDEGAIVTVAGATVSPEFPTTPGAYRTILEASEGFVCRLDPSQTGSAQLVWSTFLGGSGFEGIECAGVDAVGVVTVGGDTSSADFPTTPGAFRSSMGSRDSYFVSQLDPSRTGAAQLIYSTFFLSEPANVHAAIIDENRVVTVAGSTRGELPTTPGAYASALAGGFDVFVSRLDPRLVGAAQLVWSTLLGGVGDEVATVLAVDRDGVATIAGRTYRNSNFPTTPGAFARTFYGGFIDAFVSQLDPSRTGSAQLLYSTFLGPASESDAVSVDQNGFVTVAGRTNSSSFPTTPGAFQSSLGGSGDVFVTRLDLTRSGAAQLAYSTLLGGSGFERCHALQSHAGGTVTLAGVTDSQNYPTTPGAYAASPSGSAWDVVVTRLELGTYVGEPGSRDPDLAYAERSGRYLVVWTEGSSSGGQLVDGTGERLGTPLAFGGLGASVASVRARDRFVVGTMSLSAQWRVELRSVDPATGSPSAPAALVLAGPGSWSGLELAGNVTAAGDTALAVWEHHDPGTMVSTVHGVGVTVDAGGALSLSPVRTLRVGAARPRISTTGGEVGRYLITWLEGGRLLGTVIDAAFTVLAQVDLAPAWQPPGGVTAVDGDGTHFVVAYEQPEPGSSASDLWARRVSYDPRSGQAVATPAAVVSALSGSIDDQAPSVAWAGGSYWIGYALGNPVTVHVASIDPYGCTRCEPTLDLGPATHEGLAVATRRSGESSGSEKGLAAWTEGDPGRTRIRLLALRADDGAVTDLGGGCGTGGQALAPCAITGHSTFTHWLHGASASAPGLLAISTRPIAFACGSCTLVPDPTFGVSIPIATDTQGAAAVPMAIPELTSLVGVALIDQWVVLGPSGCFLGVSFSNAIRIVIE